MFGTIFESIYSLESLILEKVLNMGRIVVYHIISFFSSLVASSISITSIEEDLGKNVCSQLKKVHGRILFFFKKNFHS